MVRVVCVVCGWVGARSLAWSRGAARRDADHPTPPPDEATTHRHATNAQATPPPHHHHHKDATTEPALVAPVNPSDPGMRAAGVTGVAVAALLLSSLVLVSGACNQYFAPPGSSGWCENPNCCGTGGGCGSYPISGSGDRNCYSRSTYPGLWTGTTVGPCSVTCGSGYVSATRHVTPATGVRSSYSLHACAVSLYLTELPHGRPSAPVARVRTCRTFHAQHHRLCDA